MDTINAFLHFGYIPKINCGVQNLLGSIDRNMSKTLSSQQEIDLVNSGVRILNKYFQNSISQSINGKLNVLPLSGGLDSRAILGGLLNSIDSKNILAVTFGVPGAWDFEIGQMVAKIVGVKCEPIDLSSHKWKWDTLSLVDTMMKVESPVWVFDACVNHEIPNRYGDDCNYWSGFMGSTFTGWHSKEKGKLPWDVAVVEFCKRNRFAKSLKMTSPCYNPIVYLQNYNNYNVDNLNYYDHLHLNLRQLSYIKPVVIPKDYKYMLPFANIDWTSFFLSVNEKYRYNQYLYKEILKTAYPLLFSLPTKTNMGLPLDAPYWKKNLLSKKLKVQRKAQVLFPKIKKGVSPSANYIDFNDGLRNRTDLKSVVLENITDLDKRKIVEWIDIGDLWKKHQHKEGDYADALTLLASLEINIKADKIKLP